MMSSTYPETTTFRFPPELRQKLDALCDAHGINRSAAVRDAVERYVETFGEFALPAGRKPARVATSRR